MQIWRALLDVGAGVLRLWPTVIRGTWFLAGTAAIAFWVLILFADGLLSVSHEASAWASASPQPAAI